MTESTTAARKRGISGSTLKMTALFTMLLDHIGASLLEPALMRSAASAGITSWDYEALFFACPKLMSVYTVLRLTGRIAFPIFCFLLVEGFLHTRNLPRYLMRLGLFALISELPFDLAFYRTSFYPDYQNVFFTLLSGMLVLTVLRFSYERFALQKGVCFLVNALAICSGAAAAELLHTDYGAMGVLTIVVMYCCREKRFWQMTFGCFILICMSFLEITSLISIPLVKLYNGERGLKLKYLFYAFYPVHLLLLYLIKINLF